MGLRIAQLRHRLGLSQMALAKELHISASALGMYEQGRRNPPQDILIALARRFQVSTDYLLTGNAYAQKDWSTVVELLRAGAVESGCPVMVLPEQGTLLIAVNIDG